MIHDSFWIHIVLIILDIQRDAPYAKVDNEKRPVSVAKSVEEEYIANFLHQ